MSETQTCCIKEGKQVLQYGCRRSLEGKVPRWVSPRRLGWGMLTAILPSWPLGFNWLPILPNPQKLQSGDSFYWGLTGRVCAHTQEEAGQRKTPQWGAGTNGGRAVQWSRARQLGQATDAQKRQWETGFKNGALGHCERTPEWRRIWGTGTHVQYRTLFIYFPNK